MHINDAVFATWYRSSVEGRLWCESSDPNEVIKMTHDLDKEYTVTYQRAITYIMVHNWEPWDITKDDEPLTYFDGKRPS